MNDGSDEEYLIPTDRQTDNLYAPTEHLDVDGILEKISPFGKFQILLQIIIFALISLLAFQETFLFFIGYSPPWTCVNGNSSEFCNSNFGEIIARNNVNFTARCQLNRSEWKYTENKKCSYVAEFDLVCGKNSLASVAGVVFFIGSAVGGAIGGVIADLYGRKPCLIITLILSIGSSVITSYVVTIWQLTVMRFLGGIFFTVCLDLGYILMLEFVPTRLRPLSTNICLAGILTSSLLIDVIAYHVRDWRMLTRYCQLPSLLFLLFSMWVPESPRWLLSVGNIKKCKNIIQRVADVNKKPLTGFQLKTPEINQSYSYFDLWRLPKVRMIMLVHATIGPTIGLTIFTSILQMSNIGGNIYENFAFITVVSLPAYFIAAPLCYRYGRKKTALIPLFISGVLFGVIALLMYLKHRSWVLVALNVASKCFGTVALCSVIVWFFELYPTFARVRALAFGGFMTRIGMSAAPFFTNTLASVNVALPFIIMFIMMLFASFIGMLLDETKDQTTRETLDDLVSPQNNVEVPVGNDIID